MMIANKRMFAAFALVAIVALASLEAIAQQEAQNPNPRIALVIGNATYKDQAVSTTANDAGLVAQTLQAAGFDVVGARDLDQKSLQTAFRDFLEKAAAAGPDMQAFVYLAGRGVQYNGDNFFVPVDAQINRDADVPIEALRISDFAHALAQTPGKARIIVLDAARANPYASQGAPLAPGLALVEPEPGELIAFNAAPGTLAGDEQGPYGVYAKTLAGAMRQGGVSVENVFDQVRVTVNQLTQGALIPWSASKLGEPYYIFERAADAPPAVVSTNQRIAGLPADSAYAAALQRDTMQGYEEFLTAYRDSDQARRVRAILATRREAFFWRRSVNTNTSRAYWTYLRRYPHGPHVADARRRLAMISAAYEPPRNFAPVVYDDLPPPPPDEDFYVAQPFYAFDDFGPPPPPPPPDYYYTEEDDWRDLPSPPPPVEVGVLPVLAVGIPLIVGAVAYHNHFHHNGIAPPATLPPPPQPHTPPPLPANIKPVAPPPPVAVAAPKSSLGLVKPLPPIVGPAPAAHAKPIGPTQPVTGESPAVTPQPPAVLAPPPPAPTDHPPTQAPAAHPLAPQAPTNQAPSPPAPVVHAPPPAAPVVHAPPPAAPVVHAPPPAAPVVHAPPPAAGQAPACGKPGFPPCPK
jgi:uncharacterized caspase-like protein